MKMLDELDGKDKKIYIITGISILVVAATGFLLWRINQNKQLSPGEGEAAESVVCGGECVNDNDCKGWNDGNGNVECNQGSSHRCEIFRCTTSGYVIGPSKCACTPSGGIKCGSYGCAGDADCNGGSGTDPSYECNNRTDGDITKQQCIRMKCPTGYEVDDDKCSCVLTVANTCEGGGWTKKPSSFTTDESFVMTGYGEDADGIDLTSIDVKINNVSLSSSKVTKKKDSDTKASWSTTLSGYTAGTYTAAVTWEDSKGNSGDDCTLSATFTVTAVEEIECTTLWWYDNSSTACGQKEFCGDYAYTGLYTFSTKTACETSLAAKLAEEASEEEETTTPTTPQTGLLDEAWGKVALGFGILAVGMLLMKHNIFEFNWTGVKIQNERNSNIGKKSNIKKGFEKKVVKNN